MRRLPVLVLALALVHCGGDEQRTCVFDADCGSGAFCAGLDGGNEWEGTCRTLPREGDECIEGQCREELNCNFGYEPPVCLPLSPVGGRCGRDDDCDPVPWDGYDPWTGVCDTDASPPVCVPNSSIPAGGSCRFSRACAAPNGCVEGACRGPGALGEACLRTDLPDGRRACQDGLYCSTDDVCVRGGVEGEHCSPYGPRCAEGLFCYSQEAVCHAPLAEGETCIRGDQCADGLFCSSRAVCRAPLALGEGCWGADRCAEGLFCYTREAVCHGPLAAGEACEPRHDVCAEGLTCESVREVCEAAGSD